jgi:general stress protein YciG
MQTIAVGRVEDGERLSEVGEKGGAMVLQVDPRGAVSSAFRLRSSARI